jgi:hypothetical protein
MELFIRERGQPSSAAIRIWPALDAPMIGLIQEAHDYIYELRGVADPIQFDLDLDGDVLEALRPVNDSTAQWRWSPGFYAGSVELTIIGPGQSRTRCDITTDPDLKKVSRTDFDEMLREIMLDSYALFSLSPFHASVARGTTKDLPPIARLELLRSRLPDLEKAVQAIAGSPIRVLQPETVSLPYYRASHCTGLELTRSFRRGQVVSAANMPQVASALHGYFPRKVLKDKRRSDADIREHQQIKASLRTWSAWLRQVSARLASDSADDPDLRKQRSKWAQRCRRMSKRIDNLLALPLFLDVSDRPSPVVITSIYRRAPAYRSFFRLYQDISLGITNILGDFLDVPLARTFDLYELWCFLRLVRASRLVFPNVPIDLAALLSSPQHGRSLRIAHDSIVVPFGDFALSFQRNYREFWLEPGRKGSFSREMRPDISLNVGQRPGSSRSLIVIDAKYRIEGQLNDAVGSIHMYRDALVEAEDHAEVREIVAGAYIVTPHRPTLGESWQQTKMPGRLFHPAYRTNFKFGAVTLRPGTQIEEVAHTLRAILADVGVTLPAT